SLRFRLISVVEAETGIERNPYGQHLRINLLLAAVEAELGKLPESDGVPRRCVFKQLVPDNAGAEVVITEVFLHRGRGDRLREDCLAEALAELLTECER